MLIQTANATINKALLNPITAKQFFKSGQKQAQLQQTPLCDPDNPNPLSCLSIGDINLGSSFDLLKRKLGEPWHNLPQKDGSIHSVYPLRIYQHSTVYWVITHKNNTIQAVQLTGDQAPTELLFAGLQLGDHQNTVLDILGRPKGRRRYADSDAYLWDYSPLPISLEIYNRRLYSVRIHQVSLKQFDNIIAYLRDHDTLSDNLGLKQAITKASQIALELAKAKGKDIVETAVVTAAQQIITEKSQNEKTATIKQDIKATAKQVKQVVEQIPNANPETIKQVEQKLEQVQQKIAQAPQFEPNQLAVIAAIEQWVSAWSNKDVVGYTDTYANDYVPASSPSRDAWLTKRSKRITEQPWIKLNPSGYTFPPSMNTKTNQIVVRLWLEYEVPGYHDRSLRSLTFKRKKGQWKIIKEQTLLINKVVDE